MKNTWLKITCLAVVLSTAIGNLHARGAGESQGAPKPAREIKVGISLPSYQEERWARDRDAIIEGLLSSGVQKGNILVQAADGDEQKQLQQSESLITQGIDVLIIIPLNGKAVSPVVTSAHEVDVKVVAIDRMIENSDVDFYISYDMFTIGVLQAKYLTNITSKGNWVMIEGAPQDSNAAVIKEGQMSVIQPYIDRGNIKVVADQPANNWNPTEALRIMEQALTANNNRVDVVVASNDGTAGAAIEALQEQGLAGKVPVSGLDVDLAAAQRIVAGTQSMSVYRDFFLMDRIAAQVAVGLAEGKELTDIAARLGHSDELTVKNNGKTDVPSIIFKSQKLMLAIDKNNIQRVIDDGWLKKEDVYRDVPKSQWPK